MAYLLWTLIIVGFFLVVSVTISILLKKYHGWKSFFTSFLHANILFVCFLLSFFLYLHLRPHEYGGGGMELLLLPIPIFTLMIIDLIVVLPYFIIRHYKGNSKAITHAILIPIILLLVVISVILFRFL